MERTETFETNLQQIVELDAKTHELMRETLRAVDRAQNSFEMEMQRQASDDRRLEEERRLFERDWLLQPGYLYSEENAELAFIGDEMAEEAGVLTRDDFVEEAIIGRKVHRGVLYYKVVWRGRNFVTWEKEEDVDNKKMIAEFERFFLARAMMPRTSRLRPAAYVSRRLKVADPALRERLDVVRSSRGGRVTWSCEVEPFIWIPYDDADQNVIETAFRSGASYVKVSVNNTMYCLLFKEMLQQRHDPSLQPAVTATGAKRPIRRFVQLPADAEVELMRGMGIDELREYIATIQEILPHHYEALQRFHDADKVQQHVSSDDLERRLFVDTFEEVMNAVIEGREYPCFSSECFVCLEDYVGCDKIAHLVCGHFFHRDCAFQYFERYSKLCPICKENVL